MRLGLLADIHEDVPNLTLALQHLQRERVERIVLLGDVFDTGKRLAETVALLTAAGVIGVWGNHELGLCHDRGERVRARFAGPILDFMQTLRPRLELGDCLFTHGLPHWDVTDPAVYYLAARPETSEGLAETFAASDHAVYFVGHFHRWLLASPAGPLTWDGRTDIVLQPGERYLVVVGAVCNGWCAVFDTDSRLLAPRQIAL
jgi:predicted phosphodiesterase